MTAHKKEKRKQSLTTQMVLGFVGILLGIVALTAVINRFFLPKYYLHEKESTLMSAYSDINAGIADDSTDSTDFLLSIDKVCAASNLSIYSIDSGGTIFLNSSSDEGILKNRLLDHVFEMTEDPVLAKTDHYVIVRNRDGRMHTDYLEMFGTFSNGSLFIMRTPLESIRISARIANRFLIFIAGGLSLLGILLVIFFSRRITKPLKELTDLSTRMAALDFKVRYESGGRNEIGVLGENFNHMSRRLEETVRDLKTANLELTRDIQKKEELEAMRSDFVSNVSHELKTPIALIQGYAEGLSDQSILENPEDRKFYADVILDESQKMNRMVRNLLELNQLEFGKEKPELSCFDLTEMIRGVICANQVWLEQEDIKVENDIPSGLCAWGDPFLIEEVFTNFFNNAMNHCSGGKLIRITSTVCSSKVRITVFNTGELIGDEDLPRIWEKFYKADKARTREYGGNGIGLSIVKAVMDAHAQACGVHNEQDGVSFWFELDRSCDERINEGEPTE